MSIIRAIKQQIGRSLTSANNFLFDASADNGTMKLQRGNGQDILTVDVNGNVLVDGNNLNLFSAKSLATNGYQKLPSGLIIQWGQFSTSASGITYGSLPIAFPNNFFQIIGSSRSAGEQEVLIFPYTASQFGAKTSNLSTVASGVVAYVALGN